MNVDNQPGADRHYKGFGIPDPQDVEGHQVPPTDESTDTEARRRVHDEYVARETILHKTMDHELAVDPFDENDVEGHGHCKTCR